MEDLLFLNKHSTKSLLLRLLSDEYGAMDRANVIPRSLFHIRAAFDTIDHDIFVHRLLSCVGILGKSLKYLSSSSNGRMSCTSLGQRGLIEFPHLLV